MNDCLLWDGYVKANGYGRTKDHRYAHRAAYEAVHGPIPEGLQIDHLCRTRLCVNPEHLEAVTQAENIRRQFAAKTHCKHGHLYDEHNTMYDTYGYRKCRECKKRWRRKGEST